MSGLLLALSYCCVGLPASGEEPARVVCDRAFALGHVRARRPRPRPGPRFVRQGPTRPDLRARLYASALDVALR